MSKEITASTHKYLLLRSTMTKWYGTSVATQSLRGKEGEKGLIETIAGGMGALGDGLPLQHKEHDCDENEKPMYGDPLRGGIGRFGLSRIL
jgi:hypothetical protein